MAGGGAIDRPYGRESVQRDDIFPRPRAYKSFDSIRWLCEVASCEDAAVIVRCPLNLTVVTRWSSIKPQSRARKYLAWYWVEMNREAEQSPDVIPTAWVADVQKHYQAVC